MSPSIVLNVCVVVSPEVLGQQVAEATRLLGHGDRAGAQRVYQQVLAAGPRDPLTWSNLAALGIGLGEHGQAREHAKRAIQLSPKSGDAWINHAVADWQLGQHQDAARAMQHALELSPGNPVAALNYSKMLRSVGRMAQARDLVLLAMRNGAATLELNEELAKLHRVMGQPHAAHELARVAVSMLVAQLQGAAAASWSWQPVATAARVLPDRAVWREVLCDCLGRLEPLDADPCLAGSAVRMYAMHGNLDGSCKDVDIALDRRVSHEALHAAFADGLRRYTWQGEGVLKQGEIGVIGLVHEASGIAVDLFLQERTDSHWTGSFSAPDHLTFRTPALDVEWVECPGMPMRVPLQMPLVEGLTGFYGVDWDQPYQVIGGQRIARHHLLKGLSTPALVAESILPSVNRGMLRLIRVVAARDAVEARALCWQILARGSVPEVEAVLQQLPAA